MAIVANSADSVPMGATRTASWQQELRTAVRDPVELCRQLDLPADLVPAARRAGVQFPVFAPQSYIARMRPGDPLDPLLRQVLPLAEELHDVPGFTLDPVGDQEARRDAGMLQKYDGRVLLVSTGACAVHCRYCFRRHYPYAQGPRSPDEWQPALETIRSDPTIREVLLSGGDPLTLVDEHLAELVRRIASIGHVSRLRIHTRLPIVIPERVTSDMLSWLTTTRLTPLVVIHANHASELENDVPPVLSQLVEAGVPLLNQTVLLRGVNDSVSALADLSERLVDLRVMPYYLHQLDRVSGAAHFEVPVTEGMALIRALRQRLPGYAVPRYVQEVAGQDSKQVLL